MATPALEERHHPSPIPVFVSYAHTDGMLKDRLLKHLSMLEHEGLISMWHDRAIIPGDNWPKEIAVHLESAKVILLCVSPDFLASGFCFRTELSHALAKHKRREALILPIYLRPCDWTRAPFAHIQGLPPDCKAVTKWANRDAAFEAIAKGIRASIERFQLPTITAPAGAASAGKRVAELLSPPADFTGRALEKDEVITQVRERKVRAVSIFGMGGVGKTVFALKLAQQLKPDFPEGQFYIDLGGLSPEPLLAVDAMVQIVRALDSTLNLPQSKNEVAALYQSLLGERKALLLMDNIRDGQQAKLLIPPPSCLLLLTSRQHFALPDVYTKNLGELLPLEARGLLLQIAPRLKKEETKLLDDIARFCGYLPLALRNVASTLQVEEKLDAADYLARLSDTKATLELTAVDASLKLSYQCLPEDLRTLFRMLAVFPSSFDLAAAADVWETDESAAYEYLGALVNYSLLDFDVTTDRYKLHELVRLFGDKLMDQRERSASQWHHAEHYVGVISEADRLYLEGGVSAVAGLNRFDTEWPNIKCGQAWATTNAAGDRSAAWICCRYCSGGVYCLSMRQPPSESISWLEASLIAAQHLQDPVFETVALGNLGNALYKSGEYRRAVECYRQSLDVAAKYGDRYSLATTLNNLGRTFRALGEIQEAVHCHKQCLTKAKEFKDGGVESAALLSLGLDYHALQEYASAVGCYNKALLVCRHSGDTLGEGQCLNGLGDAEYEMGNYLLAAKSYGQHLALARHFGARRSQATALLKISLVRDKLGQRGEAITHAQAALLILEQIEASEAAKVRQQLSQWRADLGNLGNEYDRAIEFYEQQLNLARQTGERLSEAAALWSSSTRFHDLGNLVLAIAYAEAALKIYQEVGSPTASKTREQLERWRKANKIAPKS